MSIYLYIKQHSITGKLYFGKTKSDPEKYLGSGLHWKAHIKQHGKENVVNLWYHLFEDLEECTSFALEFSSKMNIVKSDQWLNLKLENGLDGGCGFHSIETKNKMSKSRIGKKASIETKNKMSKSKLGNINSKETKLKKRDSKLGKLNPMYDVHRFGTKAPNYGNTHTEETKIKMSGPRGKQKSPAKIKLCPHCGKLGKGPSMVKYHFDNCILNAD